MRPDPHVFIVSCKVDLATDAVVKALNRRSIRCTRFNTEDFPFDVSLTVRFSHGTGVRRSILQQSPRIASPIDDISSVWYRRVRAPERPEDISPGVYEYCVREAGAALLGSLLCLETAVMSCPDRVWAAEHKLLQLATAQISGLRIPETVVTNLPAEVRSTFNLFSGRMIAKPVRSGFVDSGGEQRAIYTTQILEEHLEHLGSVQWSPAIYQPLVEKACDVRVTIVGQKLFVAEIDSQTDPEAAVDWRKTSNPALPHRRASLPEDVSLRLKSLMQRLRLAFGCIDLIRTPSGEYIFLEVNPNGQWLWLDDLLGFGISDEIAGWHLDQVH